MKVLEVNSHVVTFWGSRFYAHTAVYTRSVNSTRPLSRSRRTRGARQEEQAAVAALLSGANKSAQKAKKPRPPKCKASATVATTLGKEDEPKGGGKDEGARARARRAEAVSSSAAGWTYTRTGWTGGSEPRAGTWCEASSTTASASSKPRGRAKAIVIGRTRACSVHACRLDRQPRVIWFVGRIL
ncbi:hypothetical protein NUW54_g4086 [Trametes sanguinea]|uniref:Uncharacterized protein n=1 Tax=Trametes sanguinea TaxID=158606 RepID=A0ACC1Q021_9APHY|nr:hypothetical protein NUW54_g4086 [Trametes sanguinea]